MKINRLFVISFVVLTLAISVVSAVAPFGVEQSGLQHVKTERADADLAGNHAAIAGNVTEFDIFAYSTTQAWQGYFGNVSGTIQLADNNDKVMYNWSLADPEGEVYASTTQDTIDWSTIGCFDWAADNGVALETLYGLSQDDVDGINETFDSTDHDFFYTNNRNMTGCMTAYIFDNTGASVTGNFAEVILADDAGAVVWTSILENEATIGFDDRDHDFEMLVPENGFGTDVATTTYYFYVELE